MAGLHKKNPFILPERQNPTSLEDEYDHKEFKQWVSDLSIGDVSKTARALHAELHHLNHLEMSPVERFEALELMLPTISFVLDKLQSYLVTVPVPLSKKNRLVARLNLELLIRLVVGYKTVLAQFHDDTFTGYLLHRRSRSESARRALYYLGYLLRHEYSLYKTTPKFVWKEIHGYYYYAVANELHKKSVDSADNDHAGGLGIDDLYKQILLLGLANPNAMLRGEAKKVFESIPRWLGDVSITRMNQGETSEARFLINAQKDAPPFLASEVDKTQVKKGWFLNTEKLIKTIEWEIDEIDQSGNAQHRPTDAMSLKLFKKLLASWGQRDTSREERRKRAVIIDVTCGMDHLYHLFGGGQIPESSESEPSSPYADLDMDELSPIESTLARDEFIIDAEGELGGDKAKIEVQEEDIELNILDSDLVEEIDSQKCISVNESKRGCYLTWPGEGEYKAHVGELIGINPRDNMDLSVSWSLGVIRWLRIHNHGLMGFGVEILRGETEPVRIERIQNGSVSDVLMGFKLITEEGDINVITQPVYIGEKDRFELVSIDERVSIIPGLILECTDSIMRFEASMDSTGSDMDGKDSARTSTSEDPFNSIWDKLQI